MKKVVVVSNCTTKYMVDTCRQIFPGTFKITGCPFYTIKHRQKLNSTLDLLGDADIIITAFHHKHQFEELHTVNIKKRFPNKKIIVFPSMWFKGENPYIMLNKNINGPLLTYHDTRIITMWVNKKITMLNYNSKHMQIALEKSSVDIASREQMCDVLMTDMLKEYPNQRLFTTYHHPSRFLLVQSVRKFCSCLGIEPNAPKDTFGTGEHEIGVQTPCIYDKPNHLFSVNRATGHREDGNPECELSDSIYDINQVIEMYFEFYDKVTGADKDWLLSRQKVRYG